MKIFLDNGHGGIINQKYQTKGKRSPDVPPGILEGEFTRDIVKRVCAGLQRLEIPHYDLVPEQRNITLKERVARANSFYKRGQSALYISIHANAFSNDWNDANGVTVFHYPKSNKGALYAGELLEHLEQHTRFRNRGVRSARFSVLKNTKMPAILSENGFMTHPREAKRLTTERYRELIAKAHIAFIASLL